MAKLSMNWGRIALAAVVVWVLGGGYLCYDAQRHTNKSRPVQTVAKTPASNLTVRVVRLVPDADAHAVITEQDAAQQAWAKQLTSEDGLQTLITSLAQAFAFDYQIGEALTVPDECFMFERKQYDADKVQFWLVGKRNKDDYLTLGLLPAYMYADNGDWVSGRARLGNPVAVMSSWRMGLRIDEGDPRLVKRWHTLVRHELGHTLGLHHNESRESLMFGGKSLEDLDAQSTHLLKEDWQRLDEVCPVEWE